MVVEQAVPWQVEGWEYVTEDAVKQTSGGWSLIFQPDTQRALQWL